MSLPKEEQEALIQKNKEMDQMKRLDRDSRNEYFGWKQSNRTRNRDYGYTASGEYWEE
jgi:hypothetical protein